MEGELRFLLSSAKGQVDGPAGAPQESRALSAQQLMLLLLCRTLPQVASVFVRVPKRVRVLQVGRYPEVTDRLDQGEEFLVSFGHDVVPFHL